MKILQIPEGLKRKALDIADETGDVVIDCEACYGACDLCIGEAKSLGCDGIIHYVPVEYREIRQDYDPVPVLEKNLEKIKGNRIGLVSTIQFLDSLKSTKKFLENKGKSVRIGKGKSKEGQILGCDVSAANSVEKDVDAFLYIGSG
jgi:2-(3-amino-3-carboxypropyl)histidine synthase